MSTPPVNVQHLETAMMAAYFDELAKARTDPERLRHAYGSFLMRDASERLNAVCQAASILTDTPCSVINVVLEHEQVAIASFGTMKRTVPAEEGYCQNQLLLANVPMRIEDSRDSAHALLCALDATSAEGGIRSYLGVPMLDAERYVLGSLCVYDYEPRTWSAMDVTLLSTLAAQTMLLDERVLREHPRARRV